MFKSKKSVKNLLIFRQKPDILVEIFQIPLKAIVFDPRSTNFHNFKKPTIFSGSRRNFKNQNGHVLKKSKDCAERFFKK